MTIPERQPVSDKIPFLVKQAVNHVPVKDYLRIRYGQQTMDRLETEHVVIAGESLGLNLHGEETIAPSRDLRVNWARNFLKRVSLYEYTLAKKAVIAEAMETNETWKDVFAGLVGCEEDRSIIENIGQQLAAESVEIDAVSNRISA